MRKATKGKAMQAREARHGVTPTPGDVQALLRPALFSKKQIEANTSADMTHAGLWDDAEETRQQSVIRHILQKVVDPISGREGRGTASRWDGAGLDTIRSLNLIAKTHANIPTDLSRNYADALRSIFSVPGTYLPHIVDLCGPTALHQGWLESTKNIAVFEFALTQQLALAFQENPKKRRQLVKDAREMGVPFVEEPSITRAELAIIYQWCGFQRAKTGGPAAILIDHAKRTLQITSPEFWNKELWHEVGGEWQVVPPSPICTTIRLDKFFSREEK